MCVLRVPRPGVRPGRASQGRARGADAGPVAPLRGAALIYVRLNSAVPRCKRDSRSGRTAVQLRRSTGLASGATGHAISAVCAGSSGYAYVARPVLLFSG
jgi:hypothetical protein